MHYLFKKLCIETKTVSVEYFMDKMEFWEAEEILGEYSYLNRDLWEMVRSIGYITAQSNSTKKLSYKDVISFPWDNERKESKLPTKEEMKKLDEMSDMMLKRLTKIGVFKK